MSIALGAAVSLCSLLNQLWRSLSLFVLVSASLALMRLSLFRPCFFITSLSPSILLSVFALLSAATAASVRGHNSLRELSLSSSPHNGPDCDRMWRPQRTQTRTQAHKHTQADTVRELLWWRRAGALGAPRGRRVHQGGRASDGRRAGCLQGSRSAAAASCEFAVYRG